MGLVTFTESASDKTGTVEDTSLDEESSASSELCMLEIFEVTEDTDSESSIESKVLSKDLDEWNLSQREARAKMEKDIR